MGGTIDFPEIKSAIEDAYDAGVVLVAAAGNNDTDVCYPAKYPQVISVGAVSKNFIRAGSANLREYHTVLKFGLR